MKRIISLILVSLLTLSVLFCFAGCGKVNKAEVAVLWSGEGETTNPNSLINSMDRAMYIKKVDCTYYGAKGDAEKQLEQALEALENGCQVLVVELVVDLIDLFQSRAQEIVNAAKEKDVPVVFFNCVVADAIVNSYDKCVLVSTDLLSKADVQGELMADYVKSNFKKIDKNADGKLDCVFRGVDLVTAGAAIDKANEILATEDYKVKTEDGEEINASIEIADVALTKAEVILTESDVMAYDVLSRIQESDYNTDKLTTQFIPIFTVGSDYDYKDSVLAGKPADSKDLAKYLEAKKFLVDLTNVAEEDLDDMIYTTTNVIDAGRIAGTATEDKDSIALAVAGIVRNLCKGDDTFKGIASKVKEGETPAVVVDGSFVKVRYIAYN